MFSFFSRKQKDAAPAFDFIGVDMHNHLLPGIDDGSPDAEESLLLMRGMRELGFNRLYCTPHVIHGVHPNTPESIGAAYAELQTAANAEGVEAPAGYSAEYMISFELEEVIAQQQIIPLPGQHVLVEMSYALESPNLKEVVFTLQTKGFKPILAHPERYNFWHGRMDRYEQVLDAGADFQVNMLSLLGYYGKPVQKQAEKLIQEQWISWVGTDLHHQRHLQALRDMAKDRKAMKLLESIRDIRNAELLG